MINLERQSVGVDMLPRVGKRTPDNSERAGFPGVIQADHCRIDMRQGIHIIGGSLWLVSGISEFSDCCKGGNWMQIASSSPRAASDPVIYLLRFSTILEDLIAAQAYIISTLGIQILPRSECCTMAVRVGQPGSPG